MFKTLLGFVLGSTRNKIIFLVLVLGLGYFGWNTFFKKTASPTYQTATAQKGTLVTSVSASGTITSAANTDINTQASGVISKVYVKEGDSVTKGQKIADLILDSNGEQRRLSAYSSLLSAQNALSSAQNSLNSLNSAMWKAQQTFNNGAIAKGSPVDDPTYIQQNSDWLAAENQYINQKNVISQSQAALSAAVLTYQQTSATILAPAPGVVSNLTAAVGLTITNTGSNSSSSNSTTTPTTSLGSIKLAQGVIQAQVNLSEIDATKVQTKQKATVTMDAFPDKTFTGSVLSINTNGVVSSGVTTYPVIVGLDTDLSNIYPNMAVTAKIITQVKDNVLLVPSSAIQTANGQKVVRELQNGQMVQVDATLGDSNDTQTEVISGVKEGDTVITSVINNTTSASTSTSPFSSLNRGFGGGGGARISAPGR